MSRKASQRYGQCYRKRKYPDRKEALDVLLEAHRRGGRGQIVPAGEAT